MTTKTMSRNTSVEECESRSDPMSIVCESIVQKISDLVIDDSEDNGNETAVKTGDDSDRSTTGVKQNVDTKKAKSVKDPDPPKAGNSCAKESSFDSAEDMTDYYLSLSVCQWLTSNRHTFKEPTVFWKAVSNKMINEYKIKSMDESQCQIRFEELLQRYINTLKTAKNSSEANNSFKCFGIFNTIDLNLFLTPNIYQLVIELRYKLWNGVKHKTSPARRPQTSASPVPYAYAYTPGLTQNQINYLAYYGYFPLPNPYPNYPNYYPHSYDNYYSRGHNDVSPVDDNFHSLIKTEFIDEIALRERLLNSSSVDEQIAIFRGRVMFTEKDFKKRTELKTILETILNDYGFDCKLHYFGSTDNSLGFRNSDIDLFIELKKENNYYKSLEFGTAIHYLRQIRDIYSRSLKIMIGDPIESRRCPLIRIDFNNFTANSKKAFVLMKSGISCDISLTNGLGIVNTKLIRLYTQYDRRFQELAIILKFWAKKNGLIDGPNGFTSYALIQLLVFFCQNLSPPLLPTLDQLKQVSKESVVIDGRQCCLCDGIDRLQKSKNEETVIQLLAKFFRFYANFDFTTQVIRPKTGTVVHKKASKDLKLMQNQKKMSDVIGFNVTPFCCIEDPFNLEHNLTSGLKIEYFDKFLEYVKHIALKSESIFIPNKPEMDASQPSGGECADWGISKIITKFDPTPLPDGYQSLTGRHVFYPRVKHILQSVDTNPNKLVSDLLKEFYELIQFCLERVFRCRPQIKINSDITCEAFTFAEFSVQTKGISAKIFDSNQRNLIKKQLRNAKNGKKKSSKQRIDREVQISEQLIRQLKDKDKPKELDECEAKFTIGLICSARPSAPYIELKIMEVTSQEVNVRQSLKEMFDLIPKIIDDKSK